MSTDFSSLNNIWVIIFGDQTFRDADFARTHTGYRSAFYNTCAGSINNKVCIWFSSNNKQRERRHVRPTSRDYGLNDIKR